MGKNVDEMHYCNTISTTNRMICCYKAKMDISHILKYYINLRQHSKNEQKVKIVCGFQVPTTMLFH